MEAESKNNIKDKELDDLLKIPIELRDTFYADGIKIFGGQYNFILDFFEQPVKDNGFLEGIRIYVHPVSLKAFSDLIRTQLKQYEELFGKINTAFFLSKKVKTKNK